MDEAAASTFYRSHEQVSWVQDANQVIVVLEQERRTFILGEADAAVWGWLTLNYPYPRLVRAVTVLWSLPMDAADKRLRALLHRWYTMGLLAVESGSDDG